MELDHLNRLRHGLRVHRSANAEQLSTDLSAVMRLALNCSNFGDRKP